CTMRTCLSAPRHSVSRRSVVGARISAAVPICGVRPTQFHDTNHSRDVRPQLAMWTMGPSAISAPHSRPPDRRRRPSAVCGSALATAPRRTLAPPCLRFRARLIVVVVYISAPRSAHWSLECHVAAATAMAKQWAHLKAVTEQYAVTVRVLPDTNSGL